MPDFNPMLLRRMLALRQFAMFAEIELAELAMIAENLIETQLRAGAVVARPGARAPAIHLVLEGRIEAAAPWGPRQAYGALEVLAGSEPRVAAVAAIETRTLQLTASDLSEILEDNFGVMLAVLRDLAVNRLAVDRPPPRPIMLPSVATPMGLVERLIVLRQIPPFIAARLQGLAMLAHASDEVSWDAGSVLARAGEPVNESLLVLEGALRVERAGADRGALGPGHAIGVLETLAGLGHSATIETVTPVRALRSTGTALHDVLEDHPDIGVSMIAGLARSLLDSAPVTELAVAELAVADRAN